LGDKNVAREISHETWELGQEVRGSYDLVREEVWENLRDRIYRDDFTGVIVELPSETVNNELRTVKGPELYGRTDTQGRVNRSDIIRAGTLRALRALAAIVIADECGVPWIMIGPAPKLGGSPTPWSLKEVRAHLERIKARVELVLEPVHSRCQVAVSSELKVDSFFGEWDDPPQLSERVFVYVNATVNIERILNDTPLETPVGQQFMAKRGVVMSQPLRGGGLNVAEQRDIEDRKCVGGLRETYRSVLMVPGLLVWGPKMRETCDRFFDENPLVEEACFKAGTEKGLGPEKRDVDSLREAL